MISTHYLYNSLSFIKLQYHNYNQSLDVILLTHLNKLYHISNIYTTTLQYQHISFTTILTQIITYFNYLL